MPSDMSQKPDQPPQPPRPSVQESDKAFRLWDDLKNVLYDQFLEREVLPLETADFLDLPLEKGDLLSLADDQDPVSAIQRFRDIGPEFDLENLDTNDQYEMARVVILTLV